MIINNNNNNLTKKMLNLLNKGKTKRKTWITKRIQSLLTTGGMKNVPNYSMLMLEYLLLKLSFMMMELSLFSGVCTHYEYCHSAASFILFSVGVHIPYRFCFSWSQHLYMLLCLNLLLLILSTILNGMVYNINNLIFKILIIFKLLMFKQWACSLCDSIHPAMCYCYTKWTFQKTASCSMEIHI